MIEIIYGAFTAFVYCYIFLHDNKEEDPYIKLTLWPFIYCSMIMIPIWNERAIHIHHWMIYLFVLVAYSKSIPLFLVGFLIVMLINNLKYEYSFNVITYNPYSLE